MNNIEEQPEEKLEINQENQEKKENKGRKYLNFVKKNKYIISTVALGFTTALFLSTTMLVAYDGSLWENRYKTESTERTRLTQENLKLLGEYNTYKEKMKKYESLAESDAKKQLEELEKKKQQEKQKQEEEEKKGYDSGITYEQVSREPKTYIGKKVKFSGKVLQVSKSDSSVHLRIAVNDNYKNVILVEYNPSISSKNVLEDDKITVSGTFGGEISYKATSGATISVPGMIAKHIDFN